MNEFVGKVSLGYCPHCGCGMVHVRRKKDDKTVWYCWRCFYDGGEVDGKH